MAGTVLANGTLLSNGWLMYAPRRSIDAAGVFIFALDTKRYLFLMRADARYENTWALTGGRIELGETIADALGRECEEEIGRTPSWVRLVPVEQFTSPDDRFAYHTFFGSVECEFQPVLNDEHTGYAWVEGNRWPRPLHPGLWSTVQLTEVQTKLLALEGA